MNGGLWHMQNGVDSISGRNASAAMPHWRSIDRYVSDPFKDGVPSHRVIPCNPRPHAVLSSPLHHANCLQFVRQPLTFIKSDDDTFRQLTSAGCHCRDCHCRCLRIEIWSYRIRREHKKRSIGSSKKGLVMLITTASRTRTDVRTWDVKQVQARYRPVAVCSCSCIALNARPDAMRDV